MNNTLLSIVNVNVDLTSSSLYLVLVTRKEMTSTVSAVRGGRSGGCRRPGRARTRGRPRGDEAALPVPVEDCDEAHADRAAGRLPGARTRCGKLEASEVAATPTEKRNTAAPSSRGRCQVSAARPNSAPHTENTRMNAGPASTCSRLVSVSSPRPGPGSPGTRGRGRCSPSRSRAAARTAPCWRRCSQP